VVKGMSMSEPPKNYRELLLYALVKVVNARDSITYVGDDVELYEQFTRYYSSIIGLINIASPHIKEPEKYIHRCREAWKEFDPNEKDEYGRPKLYLPRGASRLDEVMRDLIKELASVIGLGKEP